MREIYIKPHEVISMSDKIGRMAGRAGAIGQNVKNAISSIDWEVSGKEGISSAARSISGRIDRLAERASVLGAQGKNAALEFKDADVFLARKMESSLDNMRQVSKSVAALTLTSNIRMGAAGNSSRSFFDKVSDWFKRTWELAKGKFKEAAGLLDEIRGFFSREKISLENKERDDMWTYAAKEDGVTLGSIMNSMGDGVIDTFKSTWEGIKSLFTLEGLNNLALILTPMSWCKEEELEKKLHIYEGIADSIKAGFKEFLDGNANVRAYYISRIGTEILLGIVGTKGAQYVTKTVRLGKAAKVAEVIDKAGDLAIGESKVLHAENIMDKVVAEAVENASKTMSRTAINNMRSFVDDLNIFLQREAIDLPEFTKLRMTPPEMLSPEDILKLKRIRETIPMPDSDTLLSKVITKSARENFLNNGQHSDTIGGYFARAQDTKGLYSYNDYYNTLRLDYKPPGFNPMEDDFISVVRFKTDDAAAIKVPYGGITDADLNAMSKVTGIPSSELVKQKWPFSGNGFTVCETSKTMPEFVAETGEYMTISEGAAMYDIYKDGTEVLKAVFEQRKWISVN